MLDEVRTVTRDLEIDIDDSEAEVVFKALGNAQRLRILKLLGAEAKNRYASLESVEHSSFYCKSAPQGFGRGGSDSDRLTSSFTWNREGLCRRLQKGLRAAFYRAVSQLNVQWRFPCL